MTVYGNLMWILHCHGRLLSNNTPVLVLRVSTGAAWLARHYQVPFGMQYAPQACQWRLMTRKVVNNSDFLKIRYACMLQQTDLYSLPKYIIFRMRLSWVRAQQHPCATEPLPTLSESCLMPLQIMRSCCQSMR